MGNKIARPLIVTTSEPEIFPKVLPAPETPAEVPAETPEKAPVRAVPGEKANSLIAVAALIATLAFAWYNVGHES